MGDTDIETMANVTIAKYDFDHDAFANISEDAKDFIRCLLVKDKEYVSLVIFEEYYVVRRWRGFMLKYPNHVANYNWQKTNVDTDTFAKLINERSCPDNEIHEQLSCLWLYVHRLPRKFNRAIIFCILRSPYSIFSIKWSTVSHCSDYVK